MTTTESQGRSCLIGDVGGTKVILAVVRLNGSVCLPEDIKAFDSRSHDSLESIIEAFLRDSSERHPVRGLFAVAGPVIRRRARITNLPWTLDAAALAERFALDDVGLINDLEALAWAVPTFDKDRLDVIHPGRREDGGAMAVLAPGTGLGEAYLTRTGSTDCAHASEGSHADFAPADERQVRLLSFLWKEHDHVSVERVASGMGLPDLHRFLCDGEGMREVPGVRSDLATSNDPTRVIVDAAMGARSDVCVETVRLFAEILAAEAGNLALKVFATGGVYLGGGIPPRILPFLHSKAFHESLLRKGRFAEFIDRIPVSVILDPLGVLCGAAIQAVKEESD